MFNIFNYCLYAAIGVFIILDMVAPARRFHTVPMWRLRGAISAVLYFAIASYAPYLWADFLGQYQLIDASGLPLWASIPIGLLVAQFIQYWWHRALHSSDMMWRVFHQMHHSAERMDIWGALWFHPMDALGFTFAASFALTIPLGIDPLAGGIVAVMAGVADIFTHANLKTPRWLGWFIHRPESHGLHHQRGRHTGNFGVLTIWDQIFGTFENPRKWNGEAGFYDGSSARVAEMLMFRDVSEAKRPAERKPVIAAE